MIAHLNSCWKIQKLKKMQLGETGKSIWIVWRSLLSFIWIFTVNRQCKEPHAIGEAVVKPYLIKAVEYVFEIETSKKIQVIPLLKNTAKALIDTMSNDIEEQLFCDNKVSIFQFLL